MADVNAMLEATAKFLQSLAPETRAERVFDIGNGEYFIQMTVDDRWPAIIHVKKKVPRWRFRGSDDQMFRRFVPWDGSDLSVASLFQIGMAHNTLAQEAAQGGDLETASRLLDGAEKSAKNLFDISSLPANQGFNFQTRALALSVALIRLNALGRVKIGEM